ncbi:MAG: hypothetical protein BHW00_01560 [Clostridium sp. 26_22]|nr:MAG: hypothetical protein BHW00_01560 [Clostridium sp. 26_22]
MEFLIISFIIGYLIFKNNSLKKSLGNLTQEINNINIKQNDTSNLNKNRKSTEEIIESIKRSTYYYKEKNFWDSSLEKEVYFIINNFIKKENYLNQQMIFKIEI